MKSILGALVFVCAAAGMGCGGGPSCSDAAKHVVDLMSKDKPDMTQDKKDERLAKAQKRCEEKKLTKEQLKCVMAASDMAAVADCSKD